jgi:hypothetical protein
VAALAVLIEEFLGDRKRARLEGERNKRRVVEQFDPEKMLQGTAQVILGALGKKSRGGAAVRS